MEVRKLFRDFRNKSLKNLHENPSAGSRFVQCGWSDRLINLTKLIAAFGNFANAPKMGLFL
jgi:hypothetical protein